MSQSTCMPKRLLRWARILDKFYTELSEKEYLFDIANNLEKELENEFKSV